MRILTASLAALIASAAAYAELDRIDADGVTETGGSSEYARMLPRTGSDGRLSATLLPPVADWASQPIAGVYYVSGGASTEGNGSLQYPFKTLTYALSQASSDSAVVLVPATYSGSCTLASGNAITLCGMGRSSYVSSLALAVSGSSSSTELRLVGVRVGTLTVSGGTVNIRLRGATVATLAGTLTNVTVTREDLGSMVSTATSSYTDSYAGYVTVPNAAALIDPAGSARMTLSGSRAAVGSSVVAYISDITGATNAMYVTLAAMSAEDARIAGLVATEAVIRASADVAIYAAISNAVDDLESDINTIGSNWDSQLSTITANLNSQGASLANLWTRETNDVANLTAAIAAVPYASADSTLAAQLRGEMRDGLADLRADVPGIAITNADNRIALYRPDIVNEAVAKAGTNANNRINVLTNDVTVLEGEVADLQATVDQHMYDILGITNSIKSVRSSIRALGIQETNDVHLLAADIARVRKEYGVADSNLNVALTWKLASATNSLWYSIPSIADTRAERMIGIYKPYIVLDAVTNADNIAKVRDTVLSNQLAAVDRQIRYEVNDVSNRLESFRMSITNDVAVLKKWRRETIDPWRGSQLATNDVHKSWINLIITSLISITNNTGKSGCYVPPKIK